MNGSLTYFVRFAEDSIKFQCQYSRDVNVNQEFDVETNFQAQPVTGQGAFGYNMEVNAGELGGMTTVTISPNHGFTNIVPR